MNTVIIDDDINAIDYLKLKLSDYNFIHIVATFVDAREALSFLIKFPCDVVFLDIDMPNINGIYIAEQIMGIHPQTKICFVTAYDDFAIKAFELSAIDYILKPYTEERLANCIKRLQTSAVDVDSLKTLSNQYTYDLDMVCGYEEETINLIHARDIYYIEVLSRDSLIHTKNKIYKGNKSLCFYEDKLKKKSFFRTHKCYLVNLSKVCCFKPRINYTYDMYFKDIPDCLPVSRSKVKELKSFYS